MAKIVGIRIKNFRALKDVTLGYCLGGRGGENFTKPLKPMTVVIGKNGVGKSTLFDAFGFLADCLKTGVEDACNARGRGGFERLLSQGQEGSIEFIVCYKEDESAYVHYEYELKVGADASGRPCVMSEALCLFDLENYTEDLRWFLWLTDGEGAAWTGEEGVSESGLRDGLSIDEIIEVYESIPNRVVLEDRRKLGIATLGALKEHPKIASFRRFVEGWYLSYFTPDAARDLPLAGPQKHLNIHGDNLGNVVQFMKRDNPKGFQSALKKIAERIPGVNKIDTEETIDGRLVLCFNDRGFKDPFHAQQMSDGTLKVFAYLLLLESDDPPPFLCIEEPENGLYHKLLETLVQEFRDHATRPEGGSQVFLTTHQPYLVDALDPEEVWILEKGEVGFASIRRASDDPVVKNMVAEGLPLGSLWYSDYLDAGGK